MLAATAQGQTRSWGDVRCMTVLPPKAEVDLRASYVAEVPTRDYALQQKRWRGHFRLLAKLM
jgi:hypothetical protein